MTEFIPQAAIVITLVMFLLFGLVYRRKGAKTQLGLDEFSVGSRNRGVFAISAGISMSFVGGAATLNMASLGYQYGWPILIDPICVALALAITVLLVPRIRAGSGITISGILAQSSKPLQIYLGLTSFAIYLLLTAAQFVAIGKLIGPYFPGVSSTLLIAVSAALVFSYIFFRGFDAVTNTDVLQFFLILFLFCLPALGIFVAFSQSSGGVQEPTATPLNLLIYLSLPLLFVPVSHDTNLRARAARSHRAAALGFTLGAGFYFLLVTTSIGIGVFLRSQGHILENPETALPIFFQENMGIWGILSVVAVLAAIVSTLDSFGFDAVISIGNDVLKPITKLADRSVILIAVAGVLSTGLVIALIFPTILALILAGLLLYVSIFIPVATGRFLRVPDRWLLTTSIVTTMVLVVSKTLSYSPPLEPLAFVTFHLLLVGIVKGFFSK